jgi:hypothetical protein
MPSAQTTSFGPFRQRPIIATRDPAGLAGRRLATVKQSLVTNLKTCPDGLKRPKLRGSLRTTVCRLCCLMFSNTGNDSSLEPSSMNNHLQRKTRGASSFQTPDNAANKGDREHALYVVRTGDDQRDPLHFH